MATSTPGLSSTILRYLRKELLLREGHFEYRSGRHTSVLLDPDRLLASPEIGSRMGYALAKAVFTDKIDTVVTPSIWGVALAQWVAVLLCLTVLLVDPLRAGSAVLGPGLRVSSLVALGILIADLALFAARAPARSEAERIGE